MTNRVLLGKRALVTGAGRGLGRACAEALAREGAHVLACARSEDELTQVAKFDGGNIEALPGDVTDDALIRKIEALTDLDILVNNAGGNRPQPFVDVDNESLDFVIGLNIRAAFKVAQAAVGVMTKCGGGVVINMSSQMGHVGSPGRTVYCMTKHAIEGLTKAMAVELAVDGIRVNSVAPTFVETELTRPMLEDPAFKNFVYGMIPLGKLASVDDVAAAVLYLASDNAKSITGHSLRVDGGWTAH